MLFHKINLINLLLRSVEWMGVEQFSCSGKVRMVISSIGHPFMCKRDVSIYAI